LNATAPKVPDGLAALVPIMSAVVPLAAISAAKSVKFVTAAFIAELLPVLKLLLCEHPLL
jgi:hypothetical protein